MGKIIKEIAQKQRDGSYERIALGATKVSELQNDSEFLTKDSTVLEDYPKYEEFGAVAFSNKYKDLDGKPAPYTLPIASEFELGGVMIGPQGLTISENGYLNAKTATDTELGVVQVDGTTVKVNEAGVISVVKTEHSPIPATLTQIGAVKPDGTTITIEPDGTISASQAQHSPIIATTDYVGVVKPDGTSIMIDDDGTLWIPPDLGDPDGTLKATRGIYTGTSSKGSTKIHIDIGVAPIYVVIHAPATNESFETGIAEIMSDHMMANVYWNYDGDYPEIDITRFSGEYLDDTGFYVKEFNRSGYTYDYVAYYMKY